MDKAKFVSAGLQPLQAEMYALLLEKGALLPTEAASLLKLTRSNAYKVLDRLVELGLANKAKVNKKMTYQPSNPMALAHMVARWQLDLLLFESIEKGTNLEDARVRRAGGSSHHRRWLVVGRFRRRQAPLLCE